MLSLTKKLTNKSVLILYEYPNTVASLKQIKFLCLHTSFSAATLVLPYNEIGLRGDYKKYNFEIIGFYNTYNDFISEHVCGDSECAYVIIIKK